MDENVPLDQEEIRNQTLSNEIYLKKRGSLNILKSIIFELFLIFLFSSIILATFNYFNLIPLSNIFPALSSLPKQQNLRSKIINSPNSVDFFNSREFQNLASCNSQNFDSNIILNPLIICNKPQEFINVDKKVNFIFIPGSEQIQPSTSSSGLQINIALEALHNRKDDIGLMFGGDGDENRFYIVYYPSEKAWGIQYLFGDKGTDFIPIYYPTSTSNNQRVFFSIKLSGDGKNLSLIFPNGLLYQYASDKTFYNKNGILPITAVLYRDSSITIYNLNYYAPE